MAKSQTRRSISIKGETYQRLKEWCEKNNKTMSGAVEDQLAEFLQRQEQLARELLRQRRQLIGTRSSFMVMPDGVKEMDEEMLS